MRAAPILVWIAVCSFSPYVLAAPCDGFVDVDGSDATYCTAVSYVKDRGVTVGCTDDTHYCPDDYVTRLQMALFLQRMGRADPSNTLGDHTTAIGGGTNNTANAGYATVAGGYGSAASGYASTIGGGFSNGATGDYSTVSGGTDNHAEGAESTIAGGQNNTASGDESIVIGGQYNTASASSAIAIGTSANADQNNCAILNLWGSLLSMGCNGSPSIFKVGSAHGMSVDYSSQNSNGLGSRWVAIGDTSSGITIDSWSGAYLSDGGAWTSVSDRAAKTDFEAVDARAVLEKVASMPMDTWRYKVENGQRHLGPMAQDFFAAFGLGADDRHITSVDEEGVALAAIQGLAAELKARDALIASLASRLSDVELQLAARR